MPGTSSDGALQIGCGTRYSLLQFETGLTGGILWGFVQAPGCDSRHEYNLSFQSIQSDEDRANSMKRIACCMFIDMLSAVALSEAVQALGEIWRFHDEDLPHWKAAKPKPVELKSIRRSQASLPRLTWD
ncbi:MAG: hypothetical protein JSS66_14555 [Armatimonadetes bacterium]|nr:hypothetical protein [Armatimonadota bacterium]